MSMNAVFFDPEFNDDLRRQKLFEGQLIVHSPTPRSLALVNFARDMLREYFRGFDPETAQFHMKVEEYANLLADMKPKFIHHTKSKELIQGLLR